MFISLFADGTSRFVRLITDLTVKALENKILDEDVIPTSIRKFKESALWVNAQNSINKAVVCQRPCPVLREIAKV
jgi:hypothetical protein